MASVYPAKATLPQQASIVSRWLLDEASGNRADSVGSNTLTDVNTVAAGTGLSKPGGTLFDNSADFEAGNSEAMTHADNASLSITGALTISFWYKPESLTTTHDLVTKWQNVGGHNSYRLTDGFTNGVLAWTVSSNGTAETTVNSSAGAIVVSVWQLVTAVYRPSTEIEVYVNGVSKGNNTTSIPASIFDSDAVFRVSNIDNGGYFNWLDGLVQDVIIWGAALTDTEVTTLYNLYSNKTLTDTITVSDSKIASLTRSLAETITFTATIATLRGKVATLTDTITFTDSIVKETVKTLTETITITASAIKATVRELADTLGITDTIEAVELIVLELIETITITDAKIASIARSLTETITVTDTYTRVVGYFRTLTDTITITDTLVNAIQRPAKFIAKIISIDMRGKVERENITGKIQEL